MILNVLLMVFSSNFSLHELDVELSMDTYPYGIDISPMVQTKGGRSPRIDSITGEHLYGKVGQYHLQWDEDGACVGLMCLEEDDLIWSDLWMKH